MHQIVCCKTVSMPAEESENALKNGSNILMTMHVRDVTSMARTEQNSKYRIACVIG
jgi:hypothetical protein